MLMCHKILFVFSYEQLFDCKNNLYVISANLTLVPISP